MSRGIVLLAGGPLYFLNAYINARMLAYLGCKLPIEWFYLGEQEMKPKWLKKINDTLHDVTMIDLGGDKRKNTKHNGGWQNKINAILRSSFNEILFLDADSFPWKDPEYLFNHPFFTSTGCVLFPDPFAWNSSDLKRLNKVFHVNLPARQVESGQMMFNKEKCMEGLLKVKELNDNSVETYKHIYGDKDTFLIGMLQGGSPFKVNPHQCTEAQPRGMLHKDFEGETLFLHMAPDKWPLRGVPMIRKSAYPHRPAAIKVLHEIHADRLI